MNRHDTTELQLVPLDPDHAQAIADLAAYLGSARRHLGAWDTRTGESDREAATQLRRAISALEHLDAQNGALMGELLGIEARLRRRDEERLVGRLDEVAPVPGGGKR